MMYTKGDFHIHSNASDGKLSPEEVVTLAHKVGIDIMALTDHDTTDGIDKAIGSSKNLSIKVIPGIELSTLHNGESIHILGYFTDESYKHEGLLSFLRDLKESRVHRAEKMVEKIYEHFNIKLNYEKILKDAKGVIARPHIAKAIIEAGYDYSWDYIFHNIISKDSPAYVPYKKVTVLEGINLLKKYNALTVLAHPVLIKKTKIEEMFKFPFDGVECIYALNSEEDTKKFLTLAKEHNKFITAGSDYHGHDKEDTSHGDMGEVYLDGDYLTTFLSKF